MQDVILETGPVTAKYVHNKSKATKQGVGLGWERYHQCKSTVQDNNPVDKHDDNFLFLVHLHTQHRYYTAEQHSDAGSEDVQVPFVLQDRTHTTPLFSQVKEVVG